MTTYTTRPSTTWTDYTDILEDGHLIMSCTPDRVEEAIIYLKASKARFWDRIVSRADEHTVVSQTWNAYRIGSPNDYPKGFAGRRWRIAFFDGRIVETDSLWHNGKVPEEYRDRLPINAELREL